MFVVLCLLLKWGGDIEFYVYLFGLSSADLSLSLSLGQVKFKSLLVKLKVIVNAEMSSHQNEGQ